MKVMQYKTLRKTFFKKIKMFFLCAERMYDCLTHFFDLLIQSPEEDEILNKKRSKKVQKKFDIRRKNSKISPLLEEQFLQGKLLGKLLQGLHVVVMCNMMKPNQFCY